MTQPIQDPNTDRALQGFAYARDQIFRRPSPVGDTGILPVWRGVQADFTSTVEDGGVYTEIEWDCWENCDPDVFSENLVSGRARTIDILEAGVYSITVRIVFADLFTGNFRIIINDWGDWPLAAYYDNNSLTGQNGEAPAFSLVRTYPAPVCLDLAQQLPDILIQVAQFGASGDVETEAFGSTLEIVKLGRTVEFPCAS